MFTIVDNSSSSIIAQFRSQRDNFGLGFFYCDGTRNASEKKKIRYVIGSILRQLFESLDVQDPSHLDLLVKVQRKEGYVTESKLLHMLMDAIIHLAKSFHHVFIVVDGVDECSNSDQERLCKSLLQLSKQNIKVLVVSRWERCIYGVFHRQRFLEVTKDQVAEDITKYIDWNLERDDTLKHIKNDFKAEIKSRLLKNSAGMYASATFVLRILMCIGFGGSSVHWTI